MADRFFQREYPAGTLTRAPEDKLKGGAPFVGDPVANAMRSQDQVAALSRRHLVRLGNIGQRSFRSDSDLGAGETASGTHSQIIARGKFHATQGCALEFSVLHLGGGFIDPGDGSTRGEIAIQAQWSSTENGTTEIATANVLCAEGPGIVDTGDPQYTLSGVTEERGFLRIDNQDRSDRRDINAELAEVEIIVTRIGAPRIVDLVIWESPERITKEDTDPSDSWVAHIAEDGGGPTRPYYPSEQASDIVGREDPRLGTHMAVDASKAQARRLGPVLAYWTAYTEGSSRVAISAAEITGVQVTSPTPTLIGKVNLSAGANALGVSVSHPVATGGSGAIPVRVRVYGKSTTGAGVVEVESDSPTSATDVHSRVTVAITGTSNAWHEGSGYLEVGSQPGQYPYLAGVRLSDPANTVEVLYYTIEREPNSSSW